MGRRLADLAPALAAAPFRCLASRPETLPAASSCFVSCPPQVLVVVVVVITPFSISIGHPVCPSPTRPPHHSQPCFPHCFLDPLRSLPPRGSDPGSAPHGAGAGSDPRGRAGSAFSLGFLAVRDCRAGCRVPALAPAPLAARASAEPASPTSSPELRTRVPLLQARVRRDEQPMSSSEFAGFPTG
jgi:hypothetical protein